MVKSSNKKKKIRQQVIPKDAEETILHFPASFLWGTATSAHQIEGNNKNNDWWAWEQEGHVVNAQISGSGPDFYNHYKEDLKIAADLNNNAFRLSIEWSRIEPEEDEWDMKAIEYYRKVLQEAKKNGLSTFVTLHHFTNPLWFVKKGGWLNRQSPEYFQSFALLIAKELGDLVDFWITINEPMVYAAQAYFNGVFPPQERSFIKTYRVLRHLAKAHIKSYRTLHNILDKDDKKTAVAFANNVASYQLYNKHSLKDFFFIQIIDWVWNHWFYSITRGCHDFLGLNYYFHYRIAKSKFSYLQYFTNVRKERREASDVGWEVYPPGIFDVLMDMSKHNLPIYITENGIGVDKDNKRSRFIVSYIKEVYHAIRAGAPVKGYFYWSLIDNWEWEKGYDVKFGIVGVDMKTKKRTIRDSAKVYADIAKHNGIPRHLLKFVGHVTLGEITIDDKK